MLQLCMQTIIIILAALLARFVALASMNSNANGNHNYGFAQKHNVQIKLIQQILHAHHTI